MKPDWSNGERSQSTAVTLRAVRIRWLVMLLFFGLLAVSQMLIGTGINVFVNESLAQQVDPIGDPKAAEQKDKKGQEIPLARKQSVLAKRMQELENRLLRLSEFERTRNVKRSELLRKGLKLSQSLELVSRLNKTLQLLEAGNVTDLETAVELQKKVLQDLNSLYDLLESSDGLKASRNQAEKIRRRIHRIEQMIVQQKGIRDRVDSGSIQPLMAEQKRLAAKVDGLEKEIEKEIDPDDSVKSEPKDGNDATDPSPGDVPSNDPRHNEDGAPKNSAPKNGTPDESNTDPEAMPAPSREMRIVKNLRSARQSMDKAIKLGSKSTSPSPQSLEGITESMDSAVEDLAQARDELQEILRQNREEEIESTLRSLEDRFKRMLKMQLTVNDATRKLAAIRGDTGKLRIEAFNLAGEQKKIILEAEKSLLVLAEEGSSRAIPGSLQHAKMDMQEAAGRLETADIDESLFNLQADIATVLEQLVLAIQQEQQEQAQNKSSNQPQGPPSGTGPAQRPLVQKLAELKIIRQLQQQINDRHLKYAEESRTADAAGRDRIGRLTRMLAERQKRLQEITRELIEGNGP